MTDKEIESSLKVIATTRNCDECKIRNCKWGTCNCSQTAANAALDLINRQKVEIERLTKQMEWLTGYNSTLIDANRALSGEVLIAKSEAIKEFAEKLKEKISDCHIVNDGEYCGFDCGDVHECINNILKEMVGEDNA